jgi:hypothetical protein
MKKQPICHAYTRKGKVIVRGVGTLTDIKITPAQWRKVQRIMDKNGDMGAVYCALKEGERVK